jgi:N-acetyltransferase
MKTLENDIVKLIPMDISHIDAIWEVCKHEAIWEHMSDHLMDYEQVVEYVTKKVKALEAQTDYSYVIVDNQTGKIIGSTTFMDISQQHKRAEIGSTWITPSYWRTAVNSNCKFLLLQYAFEEWGLNRVQIKTGHENIRSQKAIERLGATKEGILRNHMIRKEGTIRHTVMYSIIKEEWPEVKQHFIKNLL